MFSIIKFIAGFNIFNPEKAAKIVFYAIIFIIGIGIYHKLFISKSSNTKILNPANVTINQCEKDKEKLFLGVKLFGLKLGVGY